MNGDNGLAVWHQAPFRYTTDSSEVGVTLAVLPALSRRDIVAAAAPRPPGTAVAHRVTVGSSTAAERLEAASLQSPVDVAAADRSALEHANISMDLARKML